MRRADPEGGYVTLGALAISALVAAFMLGSLSAPRPTLGRAAIALDAFETSVLLESGLALASDRILSAKDRDERSVVLSEETSVVGGIVRLDIRPEAARVDLNTADATLLAGLFEAAGATSMPADAFAEAVIAARGRASLASPGELAAIDKLSGEDFARLRPFVTVYSASATIDMRGADPVVLRAVPDIGRGAVADIVDMRGDAGSSTDGPLSRILAAHGQYLSTGPAARYRVRITAIGNSGQRAGAQAIVELQDEAPFVAVLAFVPEPAAVGPSR